jgi:hypothetical protein
VEVEEEEEESADGGVAAAAVLAIVQAPSPGRQSVGPVQDLPFLTVGAITA